MEAESEDEAAEHFLPLISLAASKLLPLAAKALPKIAGKALPKIARVVAHATPRMTRAVGHLTRALHRNPRTRALVRAMPSVARRAVTSIARHAAAGHRVSPRQAVKILGREHRRVLQNPKILRAVLKRSRKMDGRFHPLAHRHHAHLGGMHGHRRHRYPGAPALRRGAGYARGYGGVRRYGSAGGAMARGAVGRGVGRGVVGRGSVGRGTIGRAGACPTCGASRVRGVRRVCCCC
jgi:hypothetical protein